MMKSSTMTPAAKKRVPVTATTARRKLRFAPPSTVRKTAMMKTPGRRLDFTPAGDRFIPNRAKTDVAKARHSLLQHASTTTTAQKPQTPFESAYKNHVGKVLFGDDIADSNNERIMNFGGATTTARRPTVDPNNHNLAHHNGLQQQQHAQQPTTIDIQQTAVLDVPGMIQNGTQLMDCNDDGSQAIALANEVYMRSTVTGRVDRIAHLSTSPYSCVRFSPDGDCLALGQKNSVQFFDDLAGQVDHEAELFHFKGHVTAMAWNGQQRFAAATNHRITTCNVGWRVPIPVEYQGHGEDVLVTALEWQGDTMASAGGGEIKLWDTTNRELREYDGDGAVVVYEARCTMKHEGVRTLELCPHKPGLLVSGGDGGLKFWNLRSGALKATIDETDSKIVGTLFSPKELNQIVVADESKLMVWSLGPKVAKLAEYELFEEHEMEKITGMARGRGATVVLSGSDECLYVFDIKQKKIKMVKKAAKKGFGSFGEVSLLELR
ncbi:WD domain, G-beta repeat [Seminavis robusta]|uniref:WD domain, G-beta repeat n=1 Tax=Seminavis robusta TaxID=568900 RepID=A0A9N8DXZ4_9STRA|nr:WD domain, G-beta repeat [Seminavis robusta]|eukprot:Sro440_g143540.1 WD domain, G-beta repeat (492) ;mRNA; r:45548-47023